MDVEIDPILVTNEYDMLGKSMGIAIDKPMVEWKGNLQFYLFFSNEHMTDITNKNINSNLIFDKYLVYHFRHHDSLLFSLHRYITVPVTIFNLALSI